MGVKHLWAILQGAGTSFDYDSLQGQVISVDINIWLHQIQSHRVGQNPHAYLIDLLKRICKLLNYGIKPIFVFDGSHPKLKRDTIISRDLRRKNAQKQHDEAKFKHILKTIHSQLLQGQVPFLPSTSSGPTDLFDLPTSSTVFETDHSDDEYSDLTSIDQIIHLNPKSEEFSNLPSDIQIGILKLKQKISLASISNDQTGIQDDNQKPEDISNRQIQNLLDRREIRQKIDSINNEHREKINSSIIGIETEGFTVQSDKIVSQDRKHVILVKNQHSTSLKLSNETNNNPMEVSTELYTPVTHVGRYYDGTDIPEPQNGALTQEMTLDTMDDTKQIHLVKVSFTNGTEIYAEQAPNGKLTSITSCHSQSGVEGINPGCVTSSVHATDDLSPPLEGIHLSPNPHGFKRSKSPKNNLIKTSADLGLVIPPKSALKSMECLSHVSDDVFQITPSLTPRAKRVCVQDTPAMEGDTKLELYTEIVPNSFSEESIPPTPISPNYDTTDQSNPCLAPLPPTPSSEDTDPSNDTLSNPSILIGSDSQLSSILAPSSSLEEIRRDMSELTKVVARNQRIMHGINREIQDAVMELLSVFGIPYIVAPFEAEAQCANLELSKVTSGTITDDSDIFLFGGETVYRHFFNMKSRLGTQCYSMDNIAKCFDLAREDLIRLAFLLGCDYTEGVKGIGPKHATTLLKSFKSEGLQPLTDILASAETAKTGVKTTCGGVEDGLLSRVDFPRGFPDENVWNAFLTPLVDPVPLEEFKWGSIDVDKFVNFSKRYFNWKESQAREQITPVLRRQSTPKQVQIKIPRSTPRPASQAPTKANYKGAKLSDSD